MSNPPSYEILYGDQNEDKIFKFLHTVLVTVFDTYSTNGLAEDLMALHHWDHDEPGNSVFLPVTGLHVDDLGCVVGFQDHGEISITTDRPLLQNLHPLLSRYVKEFKSLGQVHTDMDGAIISHILDCLRKPNPITLGHQIPVKFYSLSVASAAEDALFNGEESVWKWMKLPSPYGKGMQWSRNWNVMRGAYFNIGKNLSLMVKGVGREEKERLFKDKQTMKYMDNPRARGEKAICEKET